MNISVFCGATLPANISFIEAAAQLGHLIAKEGHTLLYGGSNLGLMGVVSSAALSDNGHVIGVIPSFFSEEIILSQTVTELVRVASIAERKAYLITHSDAFIALPGGIGTIDEVFEVLVANQLGRCSKPLGLLNTQGFYNKQVEMFQHMQDEGFYNYSEARYLIVDEQPESMLQMLASYVPLRNENSVSRRLRPNA